MALYKEFDLNYFDTPKPWAPRESQVWEDLIDTVVGDAITVGKEVSGHLHNKIYSPLGVAGIEIGAAGDAQILNLAVAGVVTNQATGSLGTVAVLSINLGGTNSVAPLNNDRVMVSNGGQIVESTITAAELELLDGMVSVSTGVGDNDKLVTQGYVDDVIIGESHWDRVGTVLSPHTAGDDVTTTGVVTGSSIITGSDIGIVGDTDLIQLTAANVIQVNARLGINGALGDWHTNVQNVIQFGSSVAGYDSAVYQRGANFGLVVGAIYDLVDDRWEWMSNNQYVNRIYSSPCSWTIETLDNGSPATPGSPIAWSDSNTFIVDASIGTFVNFNQKNYNFTVNASGIGNALHVSGAKGHVGINRIPYANWHTDFAVMEIGDDANNNPHHGAIYHKKGSQEFGFVNDGAYYDQINNRWEPIVGSTNPMRFGAVIGPNSWSVEVAEGTPAAGTEITWGEVLRVQVGLFLDYANDAVHQRLSDNTEPLKMYLGHVRHVGGLLSGAEQAGEGGDGIFTIYGEGRNDAATPEIIYYGKIVCEILNASDGTEGGKVGIWEYVNGVDTEIITMINGNLGVGNVAPERLLTVGGATDSPILSMNRSTITWTADQKTAFGCVDGEAGNISLVHNTVGGLYHNYYSSAEITGRNAVFRTFSENDFTILGAFSFVSYKRNGTGVTDHGAAAKIFDIRNNATPLMTILGSGNTGFGTTVPLSNVGSASGDYVGEGLHVKAATAVTHAFGIIEGAASQSDGGWDHLAASLLLAHNGGAADTNVFSIGYVQGDLYMQSLNDDKSADLDFLHFRVDGGTGIIYSTVLKTTQSDHSNFGYVCCDTDTGEIYTRTPD